MQLIPTFKNYSSYDLKKFFLQIQVACASKINDSSLHCRCFFSLIIFSSGAAFIISLIYIFIFIACRIRIRDRVVPDYPIRPTAPPPPAPAVNYEYPLSNSAGVPWTSEVPYTPY